MSCRKLGCTLNQRKTILRDITTDLIVNGCIVTTGAHMKEVRSIVKKMITLGKRGNLHARRQAATLVRNEVASVREKDESIIVESALQKLLNDLGPRFVEHQDSYTRISRTEPRCGDATPMVVIEFVR